MLPDAVILRNYRAFAGTHRLELRPLTMLYGGNSAGKSAALRALPLLADSVSPDASGPLKLESAATYGGGFHDLLWKGEPVDDDEDPDLGMGFSWSDEHEVRQVEYIVIRREKRLLIRHLSIADRLHTEPLELTWVPLHGHDRDDDMLSYDFCRAGQENRERGVLRFRGLVPDGDFPATIAETMRALQHQLEHLRGQVQWLQAKRESPSRRLPIPSGAVWRMQPDGRDAAQVLYTNAPLRAAVSRWYQGAIGKELDFVDAPPDEFRTVLRDAQRKQSFEVDMLDAGQGILQVFPILVALALAREERGPGLVTLEEPESHLEGSQQQRLVDELCATAASGTRRPRIVLETHSQYMLLGVQRALLEGVIRPDDVILYWVRQDEDGRSRLDRITLDDDAYLQGHWPDPFRHARDLAREIVTARTRQQRG